MKRRTYMNKNTLVLVKRYVNQLKKKALAQYLELDVLDKVSCISKCEAYDEVLKYLRKLIERKEVDNG